MEELRVHEWIDQDQADLGMDWEEESYRRGCAYARELAERRLEALDDELMQCRPKGLRLVGFRDKTLVTRFGDVTIRRRMYTDSDGKTVFPLDECLDGASATGESVDHQQSRGDGNRYAISEGGRGGERADGVRPVEVDSAQVAG